jgi:hypothetical protein
MKKFNLKIPIKPLLNKILQTENNSNNKKSVLLNGD